MKTQFVASEKVVRESEVRGKIILTLWSVLVATLVYQNLQEHKASEKPKPAVEQLAQAAGH